MHPRCWLKYVSAWNKGSDEFHEAIIASVEHKKSKPVVKNSDDGDADGTPLSSDPESDNVKANELPQNHGKLILDATVAEQAIRYPTNLGLLNNSRELSERIIDAGFSSPEEICLQNDIQDKKYQHSQKNLTCMLPTTHFDSKLLCVGQSGLAEFLSKL